MLLPAVVQGDVADNPEAAFMGLDDESRERRIAAQQGSTVSKLEAS